MNDIEIKFNWSKLMKEQYKNIDNELKINSLLEEKERAIDSLNSALWTNDSFTKEFSENIMKRVLEINKEIKEAENEPIIDEVATYSDYISSLNNSRDKLKDVFNLVKKNKINQQQFCMIVTDVFDLRETKNEEIKIDLSQFKSPGVFTIEYDNSNLYKKCKLEFVKVENIPFEIDTVSIPDTVKILPVLVSELSGEMVGYPNDILNNFSDPLPDILLEIYCSKDKICYVEMEEQLGDGCGFRVPKKKDGSLIIHKYIPSLN